MAMKEGLKDLSSKRQLYQLFTVANLRYQLDDVDKTKFSCNESLPLQAKPLEHLKLHMIIRISIC